MRNTVVYVPFLPRANGPYRRNQVPLPLRLIRDREDPRSLAAQYAAAGARAISWLPSSGFLKGTYPIFRGSRTEKIDPSPTRLETSSSPL
jgi:hypothetical protein